MTIGSNVSANIASFVNTIWEDALMVARENSLASSLVQVFTGTSGTALRSNATWGTATINAITDADDLTSQVFSPTSYQTLTPAEYGAQFFITDTRIETDPFGVRQEAAIELGQALGEAIDKNIFSNFSSLTAGTIGTTGSTLTWSYFFAMAALMQAAHAPRPWVFVCHPHQYYRLGKASSIGATVTNAPALQDEFARNFFVSNVAGIDIYVSSNMTASSTDYKAGMFSRSAIAYDVRRAPRLEVERDASRRGWELNISALYAHGVWQPRYGVYGLFAGSAPDGTS